MANGREKGFQFERDQAKAISHWITGGLYNDVLWRNTTSGARATAGHGHQIGDLAMQHPQVNAQEFLLNFCVELKFLREINPLKMLYNGKDEFLKYWIKNWAQSEEHKVKPLLIVKINHVTPFWCFESDQGIDLARHLDIPYFVVENEVANICGMPQDRLFRHRWSEVSRYLNKIDYYTRINQ